MLRRERGQVAAEYVGMLLLVAAVIAALFVAGPAQRIAESATRAVCQIAGGDCAGAPGPSPVDRQAVERAAKDLQRLLASDPDPSRVEFDDPTATSCSSIRPATGASPRSSATSRPPATSRSWCRA